MTSMTWMRTLRQIVAAGVILLVALLWMTPRAMAETQSGGPSSATSLHVEGDSESSLIMKVENGRFVSEGSGILLEYADGSRHDLAPVLTDTRGGKHSVAVSYIDETTVKIDSVKASTPRARAGGAASSRDAWSCAAGYAGLVAGGVGAIVAPYSIPAFAGLLASGVGAAAGCHDMW